MLHIALIDKASFFWPKEEKRDKREYSFSSCPWYSLMQKCEALFLPLDLNEALVKTQEPFMPLCFIFLIRLLSYHCGCQLSL